MSQSNVSGWRVTRTWRPKGLTDEKTVCLCAFVVQPDPLVPMQIKSSYKDQEGNWRDRPQPDVEIDGANRVTVNTAFVKRSAKGELYINVPSGLDLDWDTSRAIAAAAAAEFESRGTTLAQNGQAKGVA